LLNCSHNATGDGFGHPHLSKEIEMKNWLKQQVTELTAWAGLWLILTGWLNTPYMLDFAVGILLISIDDAKAAAFLAKYSPKLQKKIDEV
jgi:hypothetical protein